VGARTATANLRFFSSLSRGDSPPLPALASLLSLPSLLRALLFDSDLEKKTKNPEKVTGGTGALVGASGQVLVEVDAAAGTIFKYTFLLL